MQPDGAVGKTGRKEQGAGLWQNQHAQRTLKKTAKYLPVTSKPEMHLSLTERYAGLWLRFAPLSFIQPELLHPSLLEFNTYSRQSEETELQHLFFFSTGLAAYISACLRYTPCSDCGPINTVPISNPYSNEI